ncbi:MAG: hypothetical protein U0610_15690 [bacterium]
MPLVPAVLVLAVTLAGCPMQPHPPSQRSILYGSKVPIPGPGGVRYAQIIGYADEPIEPNNGEDECSQLIGLNYAEGPPPQYTLFPLPLIEHEKAGIPRNWACLPPDLRDNFFEWDPAFAWPPLEAKRGKPSLAAACHLVDGGVTTAPHHVRCWNGVGNPGSADSTSPWYDCTVTQGICGQATKWASSYSTMNETTPLASCPKRDCCNTGYNSCNIP